MTKKKNTKIKQRQRQNIDHYLGHLPPCAGQLLHFFCWSSSHCTPTPWSDQHALSVLCKKPFTIVQSKGAKFRFLLFRQDELHCDCSFVFGQDFKTAYFHKTAKSNSTEKIILQFNFQLDHSVALTWSGPLLASTTLDLADIITAAGSCKRLLDMGQAS